MSTKKIIGLVVSLVLLAAVAGGIIWAVINFDKVKAGMDGTGLYTKEYIENSYKDGYSKALEDKKAYEALIQEYRDTVTELSDSISQLNSEVTTLTNLNRDLGINATNLQNQKDALENTVTQLTDIRNQNDATITTLNEEINDLLAQINSLTLSGGHKDGEIENLNTQLLSLQNIITQLQNTNTLNLSTIAMLNEQVSALSGNINAMIAQSTQNQNTITALNGRIADLENSVAYYQQLISAFQTDDKAVATFMYNDAVYNVQVVDKYATVTVTNPTSTPYLLFNGWTVDGVNPVNLAAYSVTENTTFTALITYRYDVRFMYELTEYASQIVNKDETANIIAPTSTAYKEFKGWSVDGNTIVNIASYPITQNTTFYAVIDYKADVTFKVDNSTYNNQLVIIGENASLPNEPTKTGYVFKGWSVGGSLVDVPTYTIQGNTTFTAVFNRMYAVTFKLEGNIINTQNVETGTPAANVSVIDTTYMAFKGWSLDGVSIVDVNNYLISQDTAFIAIITKSFDATFMNGATVHNAQIIENGKYAAIPAAPTKSGYEFLGWAVDGVTVNPATYQITEHTTFTAVFNTLHTVEFRVDGLLHDSQLIPNGSTVNSVAYPTKYQYDFVGWAVNGNIVDVPTYTITANTTFTAVWNRTWGELYSGSYTAVSNQTVDGNQEFSIDISSFTDFNFASLQGYLYIKFDYSITLMAPSTITGTNWVEAYVSNGKLYFTFKIDGWAMDYKINSITIKNIYVTEPGKPNVSPNY